MATFLFEPTLKHPWFDFICVYFYDDFTTRLSRKENKYRELKKGYPKFNPHNQYSTVLKPLLRNRDKKKEYQPPFTFIAHLF